MELMNSCFEKILRRSKCPIPENILGKVAVAVSMTSLGSFLKHADVPKFDL